MQTFLPYADFSSSAASLDNKRLGKQRVETLQMFQALAGLSTAYAHHPATLMWEGFEPALMEYQRATCNEWTSRTGKTGKHFKDTCLDKTQAIFDGHFAPFRDGVELPDWLGDERFHLAHQSNLVRKDNEHYGPQFPGVPDTMDYVWPVRI